MKDFDRGQVIDPFDRMVRVANEIPLTRRKVGKLTAGAVGTIFLAACGRPVPTPTVQIEPTLTPPNTPTPAETPIPPSRILVEGSPFGDAEANEVARARGITIADFFKFPEVKRFYDGLTAFKSEELLPIFPPAVLAKKEMLYDLADTYTVPPNVLAMLASVESVGDIHADSTPPSELRKPLEEQKIGAQGWFQVMPDKFPRSIQRNRQAMQEPRLNGVTGTRYFVQECLPAARQALSQYPTDHAIVYAQALMAYNGGENIYKPGSSIFLETKLYGDHVMRYMITAEIAQGLREGGNTDTQIIQKMSSLEVDARARAMGEYFKRHPLIEDEQYDTVYNPVMKAVADMDPKRPPQDAMETFLLAERQKFIQHPDTKTPASAGLRIWLEMGGLGIWENAPENKDPLSWGRIDTARTH